MIITVRSSIVFRKIIKIMLVKTNLCINISYIHRIYKIKSDGWLCLSSLIYFLLNRFKFLTCRWSRSLCLIAYYVITTLTDMIYRKCIDYLLYARWHLVLPGFSWYSIYYHSPGIVLGISKSAWNLTIKKKAFLYVNLRFIS